MMMMIKELHMVVFRVFLKEWRLTISHQELMQLLLKYINFL